ncbi:hypothetical protein H0H81_004793 [Sphagnurus paluster]|uniref:Uncharacterized protein n=1 Tax=Sphagnurus paluster TaxID=117069 RepID=A0A9P7FW48_9AGAR|nr:hypothetical protein H0H81_004793 [Sphagnurus paluster]
MVGHLLELYDAVTVFLQLPKQIEYSHLLLIEMEYQVIHDIQSILSIPHAAQELLSAEKTPTLSMALPAYKMIIINLQQEIMILAHYIGVGIYKIQEYVSLGRKSPIYAMAMSECK